VIKLSVIIPTFNEEKRIGKCIESVKKINPLEIIVVDGGSYDKTKQLASEAGAIILGSEKGRGTQLNMGAEIARGDFLMFIHADSILGDLIKEDLYSFMENHLCGFFRLRFDHDSFSVRLVEFFANLRARLFYLPYGDQAIFLKKDLFEKMGGFKPYPFLEDLEFVKRLKEYSKIKMFRGTVIVSSRRINKGYPFSPIIVSLRNVLIALLFQLGISPYKLLRFYS
jgi:rSAM/selenodomain-associated transferase 2